MNDGFAVHHCSRCGPKEACLFSPSELKKKTGFCIKCISIRRKESAFPNPVPASAEGHQFNYDYREKKVRV